MVRSPCFDSNGMKKGAWSKDEDNKLRAFILTYGHWNWRLLPKYAGLKRCGKSCRLRWVNHLKPGVKRGNFSKEEEDLIVKLHNQLGNKWSAIAAQLPGRTDNDIKNFWHTRISPRRKPNLAASTEPSATSLIKFEQSTPTVMAQPQMNLGFDEFMEDRNGGCFPQSIEEEFCSLDMDVLDWIRDDDAVQGSLWEESYGLSSLEGNGGIFDPLFCLWN